MNLNKVVRLGTAKTFRGRSYSIFCKIQIDHGKLSIVGVEGPLPSGNTVGSSGQIEMHLRDQVDAISPAPGWDRPMLREFFAVWNKWHMNDMRPNCEHQVGPQ